MRRRRHQPRDFQQVEPGAVRHVIDKDTAIYVTWRGDRPGDVYRSKKPPTGPQTSSVTLISRQRLQQPTIRGTIIHYTPRGSERQTMDLLHWDKQQTKQCLRIRSYEPSENGKLGIVVAGPYRVTFDATSGRIQALSIQRPASTTVPTISPADAGPSLLAELLWALERNPVITTITPTESV